MNKIAKKIKTSYGVVRKYVPPVFIVMLLVSFSLWYISKLNYNYSKAVDVYVTVDDMHFTVSCEFNGQGTNLLGYTTKSSRKVDIPLSELRHSTICKSVQSEDGNGENFVERIRIYPTSLQTALSVRFSDIRVVSVGSIPELERKSDRR